MVNSRQRILIVEDDAAFAYAAARHLLHEGYETIVAASSMAALNELDAHKIDIVVTDVRLLDGEPHGLSLARMVASRRPRIPVIIVTAYPEILADEPALPGPVLHKPLEIAELSQQVGACLAR
jgi:CheY-like chemotaxis protein